jgi:hypothetical protein
VFVRRTPSLRIDTGIGETDENELWVAEATGTTPPRRVLVGHAGGFGIDDSLVLAGFAKPLFSLDRQRIAFTAQTWATDNSARLLEVGTGKVKFLCTGSVVDVVKSGSYAGHIIVHRQIPRVMPGRVWRFWLLDPSGNEVGEIGESESALKEFLVEHAGRQ